MVVRENEAEFPFEAFKKGFTGKPVSEVALFFAGFNFALIKKGFITSPPAEADDEVDLVRTYAAGKKAFPEPPEASDFCLSRSPEAPDACPRFNHIFQITGIYGDGAGEERPVAGPGVFYEGNADI